MKREKSKSEAISNVIIIAITLILFFAVCKAKSEGVKPVMNKKSKSWTDYKYKTFSNDSTLVACSDDSLQVNCLIFNVK